MSKKHYTHLNRIIPSSGSNPGGFLTAAEVNLIENFIVNDLQGELGDHLCPCTEDVTKLCPCEYGYIVDIGDLTLKKGGTELTDGSTKQQTINGTTFKTYDVYIYGNRNQNQPGQIYNIEIQKNSLSVIVEVKPILKYNE